MVEYDAREVHDQKRALREKPLLPKRRITPEAEEKSIKGLSMFFKQMLNEGTFLMN